MNNEFGNKRFYISSDYAEDDGDREVVEVLKKWGTDDLHKINFVDMAEVISGSIVINNPDCRACDLKEEFNKQIAASSTVIFIVGNKTALRTAGETCPRNYKEFCQCTPYKQNAKGSKFCRYWNRYPKRDVQNIFIINNYSYLRHEFEQAQKRNKRIVILYNSSRCEESWLPYYMEKYKDIAIPFWAENAQGKKVGNYFEVKKALGYT